MYAGVPSFFGLGLEDGHVPISGFYAVNQIDPYQDGLSGLQELLTGVLWVLVWNGKA